MCSKQYLLFVTLRVSLISNDKGSREDKRRNSNCKEEKKLMLQWLQCQCIFQCHCVTTQQQANKWISPKLRWPSKEIVYTKKLQCKEIQSAQGRIAHNSKADLTTWSKRCWQVRFLPQSQQDKVGLLTQCPLMNLSTRSLCLHKPNNYPLQQARANMPMSSETCSKNTYKSLLLSETLDFSCVSHLCLYSVKWGAMEQPKSEAGEAFCCIRLKNILKYLSSPWNLSPPW